MILIDTHHLIHRIIFAATVNPNFEKPKKGEKYNTSVLKGIFLHMFFNNIKMLKQKFEEDYGDIIFCVDKSSWRKDIYPQYKEHRKKAREESQIDWKSFYPVIDELIQTLDNDFPFKVIAVNKAEGDDIIAVLAKTFHKQESVLVVSEDKDMKQLKKYGINIYKPIQKAFDQSSIADVTQYMQLHILLGDKVDNIPSIKEFTELSVDFIKYLASQNFYITDVVELSQLDIFNKFITEFTNQFPDKLVFKKGNFGEVKATKFLEDLHINLEANPLYKKHYDRNNRLISFDYIPTEISDLILEEYNSKNNMYNTNKMRSFFISNMLSNLITEVDSFMPIDGYTNTTNLSDWF